MLLSAEAVFDAAWLVQAGPSLILPLYTTPRSSLRDGNAGHAVNFFASLMALLALSITLSTMFLTLPAD